MIVHDRYRCELRDHGHTYRVEAQLYLNEEFRNKPCSSNAVENLVNRSISSAALMPIVDWT